MPSRFATALVVVAGLAMVFGVGVAFGLGLLAPLPHEEREQMAAAAPALSTARPDQTTGSAASGDDRSLTPVYPTRLNGPQNAAAQPEQAPEPPGSVASATQQAGPPTPAPAAPAAQADTRPAPRAETKATSPAPEPSLGDTGRHVTPVSLDAARADGLRACDVDACSRAYRSFRASDCTYQPYSGPRQLCTTPPQASRATIAQRRVTSDTHSSTARRDELDAAAREVRHMTGGDWRSDGASVVVIDDNQ